MPTGFCTLTAGCKSCFCKLAAAQERLFVFTVHACQSQRIIAGLQVNNGKWEVDPSRTARLKTGCLPSRLPRCVKANIKSWNHLKHTVAFTELPAAFGSLLSSPHRHDIPTGSFSANVVPGPPVSAQAGYSSHSPRKQGAQSKYLKSYLRNLNDPVYLEEAKGQTCCLVVFHNL